MNQRDSQPAEWRISERSWFGTLQATCLAFLLVCLPAHQRALATEPADTNEAIAHMQRLVDGLAESRLKSQLNTCLAERPATELLRPHPFSIGHRGAPMRYAEHTRESYVAAAALGAGVLECDVTFTRDRQLVCRHSQCDLHRTTNILATPLASACTQAFEPAANGRKASARCCTSDITLAQFLTLKGRSDSVNRQAQDVAAYLTGKDSAGGGRHVDNGTLMTHQDSIALFKELGVAMTPELKRPEVTMPFDGGYTQEQYASDMMDAYQQAGVAPERLYAQSFRLDDVLYWKSRYPKYGHQAIWLDGRYRGGNRVDPNSPASFEPSMQELAAKGVRTIAPPLWMLLGTSDGMLTASAYARNAQQAGLNLIAWTLERSGDMSNGGGWYYQTVKGAISGRPDMLRALHSLQTDAGVQGVFSDWPGTTTIYANCLEVPR